LPVTDAPAARRLVSDPECPWRAAEVSGLRRHLSDFAGRKLTFKSNILGDGVIIIIIIGFNRTPT
jgi:hypothetical protein